MINWRAYLGFAFEKEAVGIDAVRDGVSDDWEPMENDRRLIRVLEKELAEHIENHTDRHERDQGRESDNPGWGRRGALGQRASNCGDETHGAADRKAQQEAQSVSEGEEVKEKGVRDWRSGRGEKQVGRRRNED